MGEREEENFEMIRKVKLFVACGLWSISIIGTLIEAVFMRLGNQVVGLEETDDDG